MSDTKDFGDVTKILCPFCGTPWVTENIRLYDMSCDEYETTGPFNFQASIEIKCHECNRLMYKKEGIEDDV